MEYRRLGTTDVHVRLIVLAAKIAGPARQPHNPRHIRGEGNQFDRKNLTEALNDSLKRLQTDYVDLCTSCIGPIAAR